MAGLPAGVAQAQADFEARFATLVAVRDSAHHPEDRVRGVRGGRGGETQIVAQPILGNAIHALGGGVIVLDFLDNNRYGGTLADGTYGEVEISAGTIAGAQQVIQQVLTPSLGGVPASTNRCDCAGHSHAAWQPGRLGSQPLNQSREALLIDTLRSPVIEWSPAYEPSTGGRSGRGRLWFPTGYWNDDSMYVEMPRDFLGWGDRLLRWVRRNWKKGPSGYYESPTVGPG